jgi:nicotinamide phosphoribosyltransferase
MNIHIPTLLDADSYKMGHPEEYSPDIQRINAYFTFRGNTLPIEDSRIVFFGMRWMYESFLSVPITMEDIYEADEYLAHHGVAGTQYQYPRDLFIKVIEENNGYWPVTIRSLREGQCVHPGIPCFVISAKAPYQGLVTFLESRLMRLWSPSCTATKSALVRDCLEFYFEKTVDPDSHFLLDSRFHDFGSRGTSSAETAMVTGIGHLLFFEGTDTMTAGWLATKWNAGVPIGQSVIATEHSVMTTWDSELKAILNLIEKSPEGAILSVVADSYDYHRFLKEILPLIVEPCRAKNQFFVVRPDSGDPQQAVLDGLFYLEKAFGSTKNSLGYRVINGAGLIQGDGLELQDIGTIADAVYRAGYSAQCVAYGMGGGLLQKQNRDTLKAAIKACEIELQDGTVKPIMKRPSSDVTKISLPGNFSVCYESHDLNKANLMVFPYLETLDDLLEVIWDQGPVDYQFDYFNLVRTHARMSWKECSRFNEVLSPEMKEKLMTVQETLNK